MIKKLFIFLATFFTFLIFAPFSVASTLYLSPGSANVPAGSTVSVSVGINTAGESVNGASAYLSYPADKLEVAWISYGSSFPIAAEGTYGGGSIRISRGSISGVVGNVNVATIGFKGKAQGAATVAFVGGSGAPRTSDSSDSLNLGGSSGGVYTIGVPLKVSITPGATDTAKPIISKVVASLLATNSATISWQTDEKSDSTVEYGLLPNKYFLQTQEKELVTEHKVVLAGPLLTPGVTLNFRVRSKDEDNNETVDTNKMLQLIGYTVTIKVLDTKNNPVKDTEVLLYSPPLKARTIFTGEATFVDVTHGKHLVVVRLKSFDKTGEIEVLDSPLSQSFSLTLDLDSSKTLAPNPYILAFALSMAGIVIILLVLIFLKRIKNNAIQVPSQNNEKTI